MAEYERSKAARVRELCRKLKPVIGEQAERIWMAYVAEDEAGKTQVQDYLELLAAQHFHGSLEDDGPGLIPPTADDAAGEYNHSALTPSPAGSRSLRRETLEPRPARAWR